MIEKIQKDLDDGKFNEICSNESTFKKYVIGILEEYKKVWLDVQFLDKYSEDEDYWIKLKGNNHCVEMHISDFEKLSYLINIKI